MGFVYGATPALRRAVGPLAKGKSPTTRLEPMPPKRPSSEVLAFNNRIAEETSDLPRIWDVGAPAVRTAREEGQSVFGEIIRSDRATTMEIPGPAGPIPLRIIKPETVRGVYLHLHGGGWTLGSNDHADLVHERLADATGLAVMAPGYRLSPEHPYPAGPDDCEAAGAWLIDHAHELFDTDVLTIGGESAGAHLAAVTMIRLRNRLGTNCFSAAALMYGAYDLRGTPSVGAFGDQPLILNEPNTRWFVQQFAAGRDLTSPDISPLFADLSGLPSALFLVGDNDPLLDDSLFMDARWRAAGNESRLEIWPGAIHAFDFFDTRNARAARDSVHAFLSGVLARHSSNSRHSQRSIREILFLE